MSVVIFLSCNHKGCDTVAPTDAETVAAARIALRLKGWTTTTRYDARRGHQVTDDQCATHAVEQQGGHAAADLDRRVPGEECTGTVACKDAQGFPLPKDDPRRLIFDWCGHDNLGHRMANILLREGFKDVTALVGAKEGDLLDLRGWGEMCMKRWELFKEMDRAS